MKMKYVLIGVAILFVVLLFLLKGGMKVEISSVKNFRFFYTMGYAINSDVSYELKCDDKCVVTYKKYGESLEDASSVGVDDKFVMELENVLKKYDVGAWDGFNKSNKNVLDGDSFSISVSFVDGSSISASGYMMYPKNYRGFRDEIDNLFQGKFK